MQNLKWDKTYVFLYPKTNTLLTPAFFPSFKLIYTMNISLAFIKSRRGKIVEVLYKNPEKCFMLKNNHSVYLCLLEKNIKGSQKANSKS